MPRRSFACTLALVAITWPAFYLRDRRGLIRYVHFGEGRYRETDDMIRALLAENQ